jgi:hypothetical protein
MSAALRVLAVLPGPVLGGPPLIFAVALGVGIHNHRTRRTHR